MGVSHSLVIATKDDVAKIEESYDPVGDFGGMFSRIDSVSLWSLMDLIKGGNEYIEDMSGFDLVNPEAAESPEGPWVTSVHEDLKTLLFSIEDNQKPILAEKWSQTEELNGWQAKDLEEAINLMIECFKTADEQGKEIFVVNAL